jgi:cytochrome c553
MAAMFVSGKKWPRFIPALAMLTAFSAFAGDAPPDHQGMRHRLAACATCHGKNGGGDLQDGGVYPRLAGQPEDYLYEQLLHFKSTRRTGIPPVSIMHRLLSGLPASYLQLVARFYHEAEPPFPLLPPRIPAGWKRGRELVRHGVPDKRIAPCSRCHGADLEGRAPSVPALAGQYARYLTVQFEHWKQGARHNPVHAHIAETLTSRDIQAISHYLASLRPDGAKGKTK